jgi:hypothetical protein
MTPLDKQVEAVAAMLRAAGGVVNIDPDAPDHIKQAFLDIALDCPECRGALMGKHDGKQN